MLQAVDIFTGSLASQQDRDVHEKSIIYGESHYNHNQPGDTLRAARELAIEALREEAQGGQANQMVDMRTEHAGHFGGLFS